MDNFNIEKYGAGLYVDMSALHWFYIINHDESCIDWVHSFVSVSIQLSIWQILYCLIYV